jgi:hypothetical protein
VVSPFLYGFSANHEASFPAWFGGGGLVVLGLAGLLFLSQVELWLALPVAGFLLWSARYGGFLILTEAVWSQATVALAILVLSAVGIWLRRGSPPLSLRRVRRRRSAGAPAGSALPQAGE